MQKAVQESAKADKTLNATRSLRIVFYGTDRFDQIIVSGEFFRRESFWVGNIIKVFKQVATASIITLSP